MVKNGKYIWGHENEQLEFDPDSGRLLVDRVIGGSWRPMPWTFDDEDEDEEDGSVVDDEDDGEDDSFDRAENLTGNFDDS